MMPVLARVTAVISAEDELGLDEIILRLERIARNNPDFATVYQHLGNANAKNGDLAEAEAAFARALAIRPGDPQPLISLAGVKIRQRRIPEAIEIYRQLVMQIPDHFDGLYALSKLLVAQGEYAEAVELQTRALEVRPRDLYLPDMLADAVIVLNRGDDGIAVFEGRLEAEPNLPLVRNALARLLDGRDDLEQAVTVLRDGIVLSPKQYELINNLAYMLATSNDIDIRRPIEAIVMMERVCEDTAYEEPRYLYTLSLVYAAMLRLDESITVAQRARQLASASEDPRIAKLAPTIGLSIHRYKQMKEEGQVAARSVLTPVGHLSTTTRTRTPAVERWPLTHRLATDASGDARGCWSEVALGPHHRSRGRSGRDRRPVRSLAPVAFGRWLHRAARDHGFDGSAPQHSGPRDPRRACRKQPSAGHLRHHPGRSNRLLRQRGDCDTDARPAGR